MNISLYTRCNPTKSLDFLNEALIYQIGSGGRGIAICGAVRLRSLGAETGFRRVTTYWLLITESTKG